MNDPYLVLNRNPNSPDVIHHNPGEQCNTQADEMKGREVIDPDTAEALLNDGSAIRCRHCNLEGAP